MSAISVIASVVVIIMEDVLPPPLIGLHVGVATGWLLHARRGHKSYVS